jgi:hypothetical protein
MLACSHRSSAFLQWMQMAELERSQVSVRGSRHGSLSTTICDGLAISSVSREHRRSERGECATACQSIMQCPPLPTVASSPPLAVSSAMAPINRKITLGEMREMGVRGLLVYCSDYHCSHWKAISGDKWPDDVRLSDLEPRFVCEACGRRGADLRPNFHGEADSRKQLRDVAF